MIVNKRRQNIKRRHRRLSGYNESLNLGKLRKSSGPYQSIVIDGVDYGNLTYSKNIKDYSITVAVSPSDKIRTVGLTLELEDNRGSFIQSYKEFKVTSESDLQKVIDETNKIIPKLNSINSYESYMKLVKSLKFKIGYDDLSEGFNTGKFKPFSTTDYYGYGGITKGYTDSGDVFDPLISYVDDIDILVGFAEEDSSAIKVYWNMMVEDDDPYGDETISDAGKYFTVKSDRDIENAINLGKKLISRAKSVRTRNDFHKASKSLGLEIYR